MRRLLAVAVLGTALAACSEQPTSPQDTFQPVMSKADAGLTVRFEEDFVVTGRPIGPCGGWEVLTDFDIHMAVMERSNKAGQPVQAIISYRLNAPSAYYNSADPTKVVVGKLAEHQVEHYFDYVDGVPGLGRVAGPSFLITIPHHGVVFAETGVTLIDPATWEILFHAGPADWSEGDLAALCNYLQ